jgi:hypothetical protein
MRLGTPLSRDVKYCIVTRVFNAVPGGEPSTPTFATYAFSHVYLLFNKIQRHISDIADGARHVCAGLRHAGGTPTSNTKSVLRVTAGECESRDSNVALGRCVYGAALIPSCLSPVARGGPADPRIQPALSRRGCL